LFGHPEVSVISIHFTAKYFCAQCIIDLKRLQASLYTFLATSDVGMILRILLFVGAAAPNSMPLLVLQWSLKNSCLLQQLPLNNNFLLLGM
jgi:hypothetical protein